MKGSAGPLYWEFQHRLQNNTLSVHCESAKTRTVKAQSSAELLFCRHFLRNRHGSCFILPQLVPNDVHVSGSINPNANGVWPNSDDRHGNVIANQDAFTGFSRENQHDSPSPSSGCWHRVTSCHPLRHQFEYAIRKIPTRTTGVYSTTLAEQKIRVNSLFSKCPKIRQHKK